MEKFRLLKVWQRAHQLVLAIYQATSIFPEREKYGLVSQMRRAAVSVAANIAEGTKRKTVADRLYFHTISDTSLEEVKYYLILSQDLGFIDIAEYENCMDLSQETGKMLQGLSNAIKEGGVKLTA